MRATGDALLSRRGLLGLSFGGAVGALAGRGLRPPPVIPGGEDVGLVYHEWSKPGVLDALGSVANWGERPPQYKTYPDAEPVVLPEPDLARGLPTEDAIVARASTRSFSGAPMTADDLSRVLFLTAGIDASRPAQLPLGKAGAVFFVSVIFQRMRFKYQDRTYRYGLIEAGHVGQNAYLAAVSAGLGACAVGAFLDDEMNAMLGIDGREEAVVYMLGVGAV